MSGSSDAAGLPLPSAPPSPPQRFLPDAERLKLLGPPHRSKQQPALTPKPRDDPAPPPRPEDIRPDLPALKQPRAGLAINGQRLDRHLLSASVTNNAYAEADRFRVTVSVPKTGDFGPAFWDQEEMDVEIFGGFGTEAPPDTSLFSGRLDDVEWDMEKRQVTLVGRDFTGDLIDTKTTEKFVNNTASQIAEILASRHGLTPVVTATNTLSGYYYQLEHARLNDDTSEWNLLTYLAEQEDMDVYVLGKELRMEPRSFRTSRQRWVLKYEPETEERFYPRFPGISLHMRRSLTLARDIEVKVVSHNAKQKKSFTIVRRASRRPSTGRTRRDSSSSQAVPHVFRIAGLTEEQAIKEAERRLEQLSGKQRTVTAEMPMDPRVNARTILVLEGTGTSFDQEYHIDEIQRSVDQERGATMSLTARNLPEEAEEGGRAAL